jgi:uncharacterized protein YndB with AHSA1/START domain
MQRDIKVNWFFEQPPEQVWECLTNPEMLNLWLMKNDFKLLVGHRFNFHARPMPKMGFDGIVYCEVVEIVPLKRLVYTWKGGPRPGVINLDTILIWTLEPQNGGTAMLLEHKGFKGFGNYVASIFMGNGWKKGITRRFKMVLNNYAQGQDAAKDVPATC